MTGFSVDLAGSGGQIDDVRPGCAAFCATLAKAAAFCAALPKAKVVQHANMAVSPACGGKRITCDG
jgi:anthranilate phosphoribosyltransferase